MLNKHLADNVDKKSLIVDLRLHTALADICMKQGELDGAHEHRAAACELLPDPSTLSPAREGHAIADYVADYTLLRAYAFRAAMDTYLHNPKPSSKSCKQDEKDNIYKDVGVVEHRLASAQRGGIMKVLTWCRDQLDLVEENDLNFLRESLGAESSLALTDATMHQLSVVAIYGMLLTRAYGTMSRREGACLEALLGGAPSSQKSVDDMTISSAADVLWIFATVIAKGMNTKTKLLALSNTFLIEAHRVASRLLQKDPKKVSERVFSAVKGEMSPARAQTDQRLSNSECSADSAWSDSAARLVAAVVRRDTGVVLEDKPVRQHKFVVSAIDSTEVADLTSASPSDHSSPQSSMKPMKRIRDHMAQQSFSSWKDTMPKLPSKFMHDTYRKFFGRKSSIDGITDSLRSSTISDLRSPRESVRIEVEPCNSRFKTGLSPRTLRRIHERVELLLPKTLPSESLYNTNTVTPP
jgi:hypothetical protein